MYEDVFEPDAQLILRVQLQRKVADAPALTVPEVRILLGERLRQACDQAYPDWATHNVQRKSRRRELARFDHYKQHNRLAPLRVNDRK